MSRGGYHSERRREQAAATREAILAAARALFVERGYARTTVADIAAAARVAVPTVYASVGAKPVILDVLRHRIPEEAAVPADTRGAMSEAPDARSLISGTIAVIRRLLEASGDLMYAIEAAAPFEDVAARAWAEGLALHRAGWAVAVEQIETLGSLKTGLDPVRAADTLSFLSLPATWRTLSQDHGWTFDEVETWVVETSMILATGPVTEGPV